MTRPPKSSPNVKRRKTIWQGDIMARKRFSPEQIIVKLREAETVESKGLS